MDCRRSIVPPATHADYSFKPDLAKLKSATRDIPEIADHGQHLHLINDAVRLIGNFTKLTGAGIQIFADRQKVVVGFCGADQAGGAG